MLTKEFIIKKGIVIVLLLLLAILSFYVVSQKVSNPETFSKSISILDEKKIKATALTAGITISSSLISAIPGDAATHIAEEISDLSAPMLIITCALYLEKFLLTTLGYVACKFIIPIACIVFIVGILGCFDKCKTIAVKLLIFAMAITFIIPVSTSLMEMIDTTFEESISQVFDKAEMTTEEAQQYNDEETSAWDKLVNTVKDGVSSAAQWAQNVLGIFIDAVAVLLITTCIIPIATVLLFMWIIKNIFGISIDATKIKQSFLPKKKLLINE